ncbi:ATP-binding cassette domain-containing protein [Pedobacter sp. PLR]|uniref:ATP-binding cassette domain-containing protein n=1 Tax=Pedobacter sp. PLR TaxID=2994465 RepID=UPI0022484E2F|nr:ATP-binding cassette domain-containing protein [Pedobacter sp. PLR]MCX2449764.1 ATP-binding cassette domain-containing protein [Pedobacter sp. PLR]
MSPPLEIKNLSYTLKNGTLLFDNLNLTVQKGKIFGLLGPNGTGKSTLFKQILGITRYHEGEILLFGNLMLREDTDSRAVLKQVGSLVEHPSLYDHLTASQHLKMQCNVYGINPEQINSTLELVKLTPAKDQKTKTFSMGMKQRLGIAMALITRPEFVLLDEPLNGLDPDAIIDIRNLIISLNKEHHTTFLISSHILSEMELVATHLGILHQGKLVYNDINPLGRRECILTNNDSIGQPFLEALSASSLKHHIRINQIAIYLHTDHEEQLFEELIKDYPGTPHLISEGNIENLYKRYTSA